MDLSCTSCGAVLPINAVLCVSCGYHLQKKTHLTTAHRTDDTPEVFRDGDFLVVPIDGTHFPRRCVKTGIPMERADYEFIADLLPQHIPKGKPGALPINVGAASSDLTKVVAAAATLLTKRRLRYRIGLSPGWQRKIAKRRWLGYSLLFASPFVALGTSMGWTWLFDSFDGGLSTTATVLLIVSLMSCMTAAIVILALSFLGVLNVMRSDGRYVWLKGAGPAFLATLPESPVKWNSHQRQS